MTRRTTRWWSRLAMPTSVEFLTRPEGQRLLDLLTGWWLAGEGVVPPAVADHSLPALDDRYRLAAFYRLLRDAEFGSLPDRDEHLLDAAHRAFLGWAVSRQTRRLAASPEAPTEAREQIRKAIVASRDELKRHAKIVLSAASNW